MRKVFRESQVYRIDHYLGKETVRNLLVFRFGNGIFEPLWNRRYVDHVQITVAESIGVETRGAFYEETGAVAGRPPEPPHAAPEPWSRWSRRRRSRPTPCATRRSRSCAPIAPMTPEEVTVDVVRGQYGARLGRGPARARAIAQEPEVDPESETETFVAARFEIDDWRWAGVPFYVRTGKRLPKRSSEIAIQFRPVPHRLFKDSSVDPEPNLLAIRIQPDEGILLRFGAKVPGLGLDVRAVNMDFTYGSAFSVDSPDAYETLILDALLGRRLAVHPGRRGRGGVEHRHPDHRRLGRHARPRLPELRGRLVGPRGGRRADGPGRPTLAADLMATRCVDGADGRARASRIRGAGRRARPTIDGIERELAKIWARRPDS